MNPNVRYCKKCKKAYDIGTNFIICPDCRVEEELKEDFGRWKNNK